MSAKNPANDASILDRATTLRRCKGPCGLVLSLMKFKPHGAGYLFTCYACSWAKNKDWQNAARRKFPRGKPLYQQFGTDNPASKFADTTIAFLRSREGRQIKGSILAPLLHCSQSFISKIRSMKLRPKG